MTENTTSVPTTMPPDSSPVGLAVGLTFFFLVLAIVIGVIAYMYHSKMRNMMQFVQRRSQKKKDFTETPQCESHVYTNTIKDQPAGETPIYENLTTQTNRPAAQSR